MNIDDNDEQEEATGTESVNNCSNCGSSMPPQMRFCRACGSRLGEGVEEYTETVRFQSGAQTAPGGKRGTAWAVPSTTSREGSKDWNAVARGMRAAKLSSTGLGKWKLGRACRRVPRWMVWVFVPIFALSIMGGLMPNSGLRDRGRSNASASAPSSFLGSRYKTTNDGVFIQDVTPPGSAADKAGLIGGDTIVSFDGKNVKSESDLTNLLINTPIGKTVDVTYIRDGETKTVKLTTVSEAENDRLEEAFDDAEKGFLGVGDDFERVAIAGTNLYGVRIDQVYDNRPAYIAGLQVGDVIIEFDKIPIRTTQELNMRIDRAKPLSTVTVVVMRGSERLEIPVKIGKE